MEKKRVEWIDTVKFLCMIAVMTEHVEFVTPVWDRLVEPFFLNMFSFAAGYVYIYRDGFVQFLKKKINQLFIPWFFFSTLTIVMAHIYSFNSHESLALELGQNMLQIMYHGSEMWYVAALFIAFLPFYFFIRAYEKSNLPAGKREFVLISISFILCALSYFFSHYTRKGLFLWDNSNSPISLPWHLEYMFQAMFFMVLGYLFRVRYEQIFDRINSWKTSFLFCSCYLFVSLLLPELATFSSTVELLLYYPRCFLGCAVVISLSKQLPSNCYIRFIGGNTLVYYALHGKVESLIQAVLKHINQPEYLEIVWGYHPEAVFYALAEALFVSILLVPVVILINHWLPFAVGRKRKKNP